MYRFTKQDNSKGGLTTAKKIRIKREHILLSGNWDLIVEKLGRKTWKEIVIEEQKGYCARCGIDKWMDKPIRLHVHHKDGNDNNDSRDNLEAICPNCHSQTKTWGTKNKVVNRHLFQLEK